MMEMNFELVAVDDLLRGPGDWDAGTPRGHHHDVAIRSALQKLNVAIMRENFRPQLQVCSCLEDRRLRRVHDNGIGLIHEPIETAQSFNVARLLPNTASFLENHLGERGKSWHATSLGRAHQPLSGRTSRATARGVGSIANVAVALLNLARASRGLRLVRVESC